MNCKNYDPMELTPSDCGNCSNYVESEPFKVGQEVWWDGIARHIGKQRDVCLVTIKCLTCPEENYYLIGTDSWDYAVDTDTLSPICPARNRPFSEQEPLPLKPEPIKKGDLVIITCGEVIDARPAGRYLCIIDDTDNGLSTYNPASPVAAFVDDLNGQWHRERLAIDSQFTAPYKGEVGEFKIVARRGIREDDMWVSSKGEIIYHGMTSSDKCPYWIVERVTPVETFTDGELVVGDINSHLYKVDGGKICRVVKGGAVLGVAGHFSKLTIGSQFTTTCDKSIYPSGKGEFLVVDKREPKTGDVIFRKFVTPGVALIATMDYLKGDCRWIVVPCDLAYYTQTVNDVAYVMYEMGSQNFLLVTSQGRHYEYAKRANNFTNDFIRSLNLTPVPLSVSAITGVIAPKVGV